MNSFVFFALEKLKENSCLSHVGLTMWQLFSLVCQHFFGSFVSYTYLVKVGGGGDSVWVESRWDKRKSFLLKTIEAEKNQRLCALSDESMKLCMQFLHDIVNLFFGGGTTLW